MPLSVFTPFSSSPKPSRLVEIPTADKTISASIISVPVAVLTCTLHKSPLVSTDSTFELVMILIPCFLRIRASCFEISSSSNGTILSKNSITVTFVPIALYKYANSIPIAPDPTTTSDSGFFGKTIAWR